MDELIQQTRAATAAGLYYLALFGALAIPDILGALGSPDGKASAAKYVQWVKDNTRTLSGDAAHVYGLRCSLLHQGRSLPHNGTYPFAMTVFDGGVHGLSTVAGDGTQVGWWHLPLFVDDIVTGAETWLRRYEPTRTVLRNLEKFARLRPMGLPPHVVGAPVIA